MPSSNRQSCFVLACCKQKLTTNDERICASIILDCSLYKLNITRFVCDEWSEIPDNLAELANDESSQIPAANEE